MQSRLGGLRQQGHRVSDGDDFDLIEPHGCL
jgi:hypothetical protein